MINLIYLNVIRNFVSRLFSFSDTMPFSNTFTNNQFFTKHSFTSFPQSSLIQNSGPESGIGWPSSAAHPSDPLMILWKVWSIKCHLGGFEFWKGFSPSWHMPVLPCSFNIEIMLEQCLMFVQMFKKNTSVSNWRWNFNLESTLCLIFYV